jgi:pilus assembly protein CpaB
MSKMRIVIFGMALGSAALAAMMARGVIGEPAKTEVVEINKIQTVDVLVAAKDVLMGEKLTAGTVAWKTWPTDNLSSQMITKDSQPDAAEKLAEARTRVEIYEGETIIEKKLLLPNQPGFMSSLLPKGMRAISVAISERSSAGGFILPNDRVDIILTRKFDTPGVSAQTVVSETVITNVRVLAVNQTFRQQQEGDKVTVEEGKTATVELSLKQAEVISMVESSGELSLALRSIAENDGKTMDKEVPVLAEKYTGEGKKKDTSVLVIRNGSETLSSSR